MKASMTIERHKLFDGAWCDPSRYIVASQYIGDLMLFMLRAAWSRYNRRARLFGRDVLIETVQG